MPARSRVWGAGARGWNADVGPGVRGFPLVGVDTLLGPEATRVVLFLGERTWRPLGVPAGGSVCWWVCVV